MFHGVALKNDGFMQAVIDPVDINICVDDDPLHLREDLPDPALAAYFPQGCIDISFTDDEVEGSIQRFCFGFCS
jgi:hypothetical protein